MKSTIKQNKRCEGYRRYTGVMGAFSLGPATWRQCKNNAIVTLKLEQEGATQTLPACLECWQERIENKIKILNAAPLTNKLLNNNLNAL